jgi:HAD superfamily hydrolase (TIGR01544 family)
MVSFIRAIMKNNKNIIIANPEGFERKKEAIRQGGVKKLHVLSDFDRTLTYAKVDGQRRDSLMAILRDEKYLTPDYPQKAHALRDKYYPIEIDFSVPLPERKKFMREWWTKHFELLVESRLNRKDIENVIASAKIKLRDGVIDFADYLKEKKIPFVIISATGLGEESVALFLKKERRSLKNIHIVSNRLEWDSVGYLKKIKEPIIHALNKDETAIQKFPVFEKIKNRKNILLLGDSPGDTGMSDGFYADNVLKVGFLNEKVEENLDHYKKFFDVVLLNDPPFDYAVGLLKEIT